MRFALVLASLADVAPSPGRPSWNQTPVPEPELLAVSVLVLGLAALALARTTRRQASAK